MRVEFKGGVPPECIDWLWDNIGSGNVAPTDSTSATMNSDLVSHEWHLWKYERIEKIVDTSALMSEIYHIPTITIKDEQDALMFALRWSS